ncbi:hypothetical protein JIG36_37390 [Actinoplanes sp. LDG1-06]|uniref:Uncharacterized protein n=1 Tax=Paractinoplanes ovalisporus TaxID=2810368 RepID=A0ABS2AMW2_9ACTN|nr:hypothetical protein [Actinoplanes ovalisporus]MBM2621192.1 hypothetical protein [Actinoplanes ovalisporus]
MTDDERSPENRYIEVRMWVDVSGSTHVTQQRLDRMMDTVRDTAIDALAEEGIRVRNLGGDWVYYYNQKSGYLEMPNPRRRR